MKGYSSIRSALDSQKISTFSKNYRIFTLKIFYTFLMNCLILAIVGSLKRVEDATMTVKDFIMEFVLCLNFRFCIQPKTQFCPKRYSLEISKKLLFVIIVQEAAKLLPVKVESKKVFKLRVKKLNLLNEI